MVDWTLKTHFFPSILPFFLPFFIPSIPPSCLVVVENVLFFFRFPVLSPVNLNKPDCQLESWALNWCQRFTWSESNGGSFTVFVPAGCCQLCLNNSGFSIALHEWAYSTQPLNSMCACVRACVRVCVCFTLQGSLSGTLPPNSSVTGYITEGALIICVHLSTHTVTAPVVGHSINRALLISVHLSAHTVTIPVTGHPINRALLISVYLSTHTVTIPVTGHPINRALLISVLCIFQPTLSPSL